MWSQDKKRARWGSCHLPKSDLVILIKGWLGFCVVLVDVLLALCCVLAKIYLNVFTL